jgi:hypothetical protein
LYRLSVGLFAKLRYLGLALLQWTPGIGVAVEPGRCGGRGQWYCTGDDSRDKDRTEKLTDAFHGGPPCDERGKFVVPLQRLRGVKLIQRRMIHINSATRYFSSHVPIENQSLA